MVDAQTIGILVTATSVTIAAVYYLMMLRINQRALRINMTNSLLQTFTGAEGQKAWGELMSMKWSSYDDFERKYGSDYNLDNFGKRQSIWNQFEIMGNMLKAGLVDRETLYNITTIGIPWTWAKFKPIMDENRRRYSGRDAYSNFEYLAEEMMRMKLERDPSYRIPDTFTEYVSSNSSSPQ